MKTSYVREIVGYHFKTLLPWESTFWSLGLEHEILEILVHGWWSPGKKSLTPPGRPGSVITWEEGSPYAVDLCEINHVLQTVFPLFLSVRLESASGFIWFCCMVPWGVKLYFKIDKAKKILHCADLSLSHCLSSRSCQLTGLLGCPGFFSPWYAYLKVASFFAPLSAHMLPKNPCQPDLHCGVKKQNWSLGPFFLKPPWRASSENYL